MLVLCLKASPSIFFYSDPTIWLSEQERHGERSAMEAIQATTVRLIEVVRESNPQPNALQRLQGLLMSAMAHSFFDASFATWLKGD